jgi:hypothetical protein
LAAGAACLLVQARPAFPPTIIRQALMETADNASSPNNDVGWGIINAEAALGWGAEFTADTTVGNAPLTVQFTTTNSLPATAWEWSFGDGGGSPPLAPGNGEVLKIFLTIDSFALGSQTAVIDTTSFASIRLALTSPSSSYTPIVFTGAIMSKTVIRGDCNRDLTINLLDLLYLVNYVFRSGPFPVTVQAGDNNRDFSVDVIDLNYIVNYVFRGGPPPPSP